MGQQRSKEIPEEKKCFYIKLFNTKTLEDEFKYKTYKSLFEKLRKKVKQLIIQNCYGSIKQILSGLGKLWKK